MAVRAALARIFREAGVARLEPKKKPRSAWRRFVYPAPNAYWQLDATECVLTGGRKTVAATGTLTLASVRYGVDPGHAFQQVLVITDGNQPGDTITITALHGETLAEHIRPARNRLGRQRPPIRTPTPPRRPVTDVLRHEIVGKLGKRA